LFEALAENAKTILELAAQTGASPRATGTLVRFLASVRLLELDGDVVALTQAAAQHLLRRSPAYWGGMFERLSALPLTADALMHASRTGKSAIYGAAELWQEHARDAELALAFAEAAHCRAAYAAERLAKAPLFENTAHLLDVGGGKGTYAVAFCKNRPQLRATLLDLAPTCALAKDFVLDAGLADRITIQSSDIFAAPWPRGFDAVWLSDIFHDWSMWECAEVASRAFDSLNPGGRILVNEVLLREDRSGPRSATSYELALLLSTNTGRQYTLRDVRQLLRNAGFAGTRITARAGVYTVIAARKPA
jgi:acetylserotonin N-methyltransferase